MTNPPNPTPAKGKGFSTRRKALLGLVLIAFGVISWLQYVGAAGISGMETKDMDWDGNGTVTQGEILQAFTAVGVNKSTEGQRECSEYFWRKGKRAIRVDCRTNLAPAAKE